MADNVTLPGTGAVVASDDVGGAQYQFVKLVDGTLDSTNKSIIDSDGRLATGGVVRVVGATSAAATSNSTAVDVSGYNLARVLVDTGAGTVPFFEVSYNGTTWFTCTQATSPNADGHYPLAASTSNQVRWIDLRNVKSLRLNNTSGSNSATFSASLSAEKMNVPRQIFTASGTINNTSGAGTGNPIFTIDTGSLFHSGVIAFKYTSGALNNITIAGSNDGSVWFTLPVVNANTALTGQFSQTTVQISADVTYLIHGFGCRYLMLYSNNASNTCSIAYRVTLNQAPHSFVGAQTPVTGTVTAANVTGNIASGSSDSGNPVKIGGIAATGAEAVVTNGQRINTRHDKVGRLVVRPYQHRERVARAWVQVSNTTETTLLAAQGAGIFADLTHLSIFNSSATTVNVELRSVSGGSTTMVFTVPAGGGVVLPFPVPVPQATANSAWSVQASGSVSVLNINAVFTLEQ